MNKIKNVSTVTLVAAIVIIAGVLFAGSRDVSRDFDLSGELSTYENSNFGYSFEYPSNLVIRDEGIKVSFDDESKQSQYIHVGLPDPERTGDFGMTVVVNPSPYGMCEGAEWDIPEHKIGDLTFSGCGYIYRGERTISEATSFVRNGDSYGIFLGYPQSVQSEAYKMAESFKLND